MTGGSTSLHPTARPTYHLSAASFGPDRWFNDANAPFAFPGVADLSGPAPASAMLSAASLDRAASGMLLGALLGAGVLDGEAAPYLTTDDTYLRPWEDRAPSPLLVPDPPSKAGSDDGSQDSGSLLIFSSCLVPSFC